MATNKAAWLDSAKAHPLTIREAPLGKPIGSQILIKNHAIAVNPIDGKLQSLAIYPLQYPAILGEDVAGEVVEAGPDSQLKPGDRVLGFPAGFATKQREAQGFQAFTLLESNGASKIPAHISYEKAVVLPLTVATASAGLFNPEFLNLQLPTEPRQQPTGTLLLVWGGASGVGSSAIQLAVAAGYEVITTASQKNFSYVKELGASYVFDYKSDTVVADIHAVLSDSGKTLAGVFDAVGGAGATLSMELAHKAGLNFVATSVPGWSKPPVRVEIKQFQAPSVLGNHVGKAVFNDFLPQALEVGAFRSAPEPLVVGTGLESIQAAVDKLKEGVSAQKLVVTL